MKGLSHKFAPVNGKFVFTSGTQKATEALHFFLGFIGWFRVYAEDYPPDVLWLIQKPTSLLGTLKTLILGKLLGSVRKYLPHILVKSCNFAPTLEDRKVYVLSLDFAYAKDPDETIQSVTFIAT